MLYKKINLKYMYWLTSNEINLKIFLKWKYLLFFSSFYILKPLHNDFIINFIEDIFFNVYNQTVIYLFISHPIPQSTLNNIHKKKLFTITIATNKSNENLISMYTNLKNSLQAVILYFYHFLYKTNNAFNTRKLIIIV